MGEEETGIDMQIQRPPKLDWKEIGTKNDERVRIDSAQPINPATEQRVKETLAETLAIAGITDPQYRLTLKVVPERYLFHGAAVTGLNEIEINENILHTERLADKKRVDVNKVLGRDIRTKIDTSDPQTRKLVETMQEATLAHEVYHLRQKNLLWRRIYGPRKHEVVRSDAHEDIINQYKYQPDERGARAFAIRYLSEKAKGSSEDGLKEKVVVKYRDYLIEDEKNITEKYKQEVSNLPS